MNQLYENECIREEYSRNAYNLALTKFEQKELFRKILLDRRKLLEQ